MSRKYSRNYRFLTTNVSLSIGDPTESDADALIIVSDVYSLFNGGLPFSILCNLPDLDRDLKKYDKRQIRPGDVLVFSAGQLHQKNIIVIIKNPGSMTSTHSEAGSAIKKAFIMIQTMGFNKIAIDFSRTDAMSWTDTSNMSGFKSDWYDIQISNEQIYISKITDALIETNRPLELEVFFPEIMYSKTIIDQLADSAQVWQGGSSTEVFDVPIESSTRSHSNNNEHFDVFISYSRRNTSEAEYLSTALGELNLKVWKDTDSIRHGDDFEVRIMDAIDSSSTVLFLSSEDSNASTYVVREIRYALQMNKPIIPVRLDESDYARQLQFDLLTVDFARYEETPELIRELYLSIRDITDRTN